MFEDSKEAIPSQVLRLACPELFEFAGGNRNIKNKLDEIYNSSESFIIYMDAVPDNEQTMRQIIQIVKYVKEKNYRDVYVIPIPCIEYYIIKAFGDRHNPEIQTVLSLGSYAESELNKKVYRGMCPSFEKYCKQVALHVLKFCQRVGKGKEGLYYLSDCLCEKADVEGCTIGVTRMQKAWSLVQSLPVFETNHTNVYFKVQRVDISDIQRKQVEMYNTLCDNLGCINHLQIQDVVTIE